LQTGHFQTTIGNDSIHQDSNDNGVRILHFAISKNLGIKEHDVPTPKHP